MKESGKTIYNMARVLRPGLTKVSMKVNMLSEGNMESALTSGTMEANILAIGARTRSAELVCIRGLMGADTKENGSKTIWRAQASTSGMTVECTKASIKTTRNMAMESTLGQMAAAMRATGLEENSMG